MHEVLEAVRYRSEKYIIKKGRHRGIEDDDFGVADDWMSSIFKGDLE